MRPFYPITLLFLCCLPFSLWSQHATAELRIAQTDWNPRTNELHFDIELKAVDKPFYLAFSDVVVALPMAVIDSSKMTFNLIPGSTQLLNLGGEMVDFSGIRTRSKAKQDTLFLIVQLMPNSFTAQADFFEQSAFISRKPGESRIGRFKVSGVLKSPELLKPYYASRGASTLLLAFDPKDQFKAVDLSVQNIGSKPMSDLLKFFECSSNEQEYILAWKWQDAKQPWQLWWSFDHTSWTLLQSGKGGQGLKVGKDKPEFAAKTASISFLLTYSLPSGGQRSVVRLPK